jgi:hypothetical protein
MCVEALLDCIIDITVKLENPVIVWNLINLVKVRNCAQKNVEFPYFLLIYVIVQSL